jgi:hypothetical protein
MKANLKIVAGVGAAMLFAGSANAAVLTATADNYSKEGVSSTGNVTLPTINVVTAEDYSADDRIALTITGATVVSGTDLTADMICNNGVIVGFLNRTGNTIFLRVNQVNVANNLGAQCTINGIQVSKASLAASTRVTASYAVETALGEAIDLGCADPGSPGVKRACATNETPNLVTLANIRSQFTARVTAGEVPFNGVIDVEADREIFAFDDEFTGGKEEDSLFITVRNEGSLLESVDSVSGMLTIDGDFTWAAGADGDCNTGDDVGAVVSDLGAPAEFAGDCASFEVDYGLLPDNVDTTVNDVIVLIVPGAGSNVKLSPQSFAADYVFAYPTNRSTSIKFSAGAWTINGALVFVPYMPYGDNITQIVYIANRGGQDGAITVDAFDEAGMSYTFSVGIVQAGTVRKLAQELLDGLTLGGFTAPGKVAFEITVTAPDRDIDVYSAYNVGGSDRGTVVNSQNGKALQ